MHINPQIAALLAGLNNPSLPGIDLSLVRMRELLKALGSPERKLPPVIHFAGTNGKGSTQAFLRAIYEAAGYRVHAYTSPHLVRFNERIIIAGHEISDDGLLDVLTRVNEAAKDIVVTFFEATTAMAFLAFAEHAADVVLLETGLGGRLDATNMVEKPIATVITPIDYDHMEFLGNTLAAIATEKAGIIKHGAPCFIGPQRPEAREVLKRAARDKDCPVHLYDREWSFEPTTHGLKVMAGAKNWKLPVPALPGAHQYQNAALASVVAHTLAELPVTDEAVAKGIGRAQWPARLQRLAKGPLVSAWGERGEVVLDGAHNPSAAMAMREWMAAQPVPTVLLLGMMRRKDAAGFLALLKDGLAGVLTTSIPGNDSYSAAALAEIARAAGIAQVHTMDSLTDVPQIPGETRGNLLIAGSLFLAGEVLKNHG